MQQRIFIFSLCSIHVLFAYNFDASPQLPVRKIAVLLCGRNRLTWMSVAFIQAGFTDYLKYYNKMNNHCFAEYLQPNHYHQQIVCYTFLGREIYTISIQASLHKAYKIENQFILINSATNGTICSKINEQNKCRLETFPAMKFCARSDRRSIIN